MFKIEISRFTVLAFGYFIINCSSGSNFRKIGCDEIENLIEKSDELNEAYNKLVYFSALAIIIRGGFTNLLEGALSVVLPINDFYEEICSFAKEIGSQYCYELISNYDIANIKPQKSSGLNTKKTFDIPSEFSVL